MKTTAISRSVLFANSFDQHAFSAAAIEFAVEDLFPRSEIESALGDRDYDFAAHDLAFEVSVGVVFTRAIMLIGGSGGVRRKLFQPDLVIVMQPAFVVIDEHGRGDVHRVDQAKALGNTAAGYECFDLRRDVNEASPGWDFEPEMLG